MIIAWFITALMTLVNIMIFPLPDYVGLPVGVDSMLDTLKGLIAKGNEYFPFATLSIIFALIIGIEVAFFLFKVGNWVFNKIRG